MSINETIYFIIILGVSTIGMVRYKLLTIPFKILAFSVLFTLFWEVLAEFSAVLYKTNALISHFQGVSGYIFHAIIFYYLFRDTTLKKIVLFSIFFVVIFAVINGVFIQKAFNDFPTYVYLITNGLSVIFCLFFFKQMLQYALNVNIVRQSVFWYNTGILLFSATMFLNMGLTNYYAKHQWGRDIIFYLWFCNDCLLNVLIGVALLTDNKENNIHHA
jgi:hypothetical protein